jgi:hypothetical protein
MFRCRGCTAKDEEIRHLLALLDKTQGAAENAQARLAEIASPGAERRRVDVPPGLRGIERAGPSGRVAPAFPGYEPRPARPAIEIDEPEAAKS